MSSNETGGLVTQLVITCWTPASGDVDIKRGDVVVLKDDYTAGHADQAEEVILGQAFASVAGNNRPLPVLVRGVARFAYTGAAPELTGQPNALSTSAEPGKAATSEFGVGKGMALAVDEAAGTVDVLL